MTERAKMKEITKVACPRSLWADKQKFLLIMPEGSRGHVRPTFSEKSEKVLTPNGAIKVERGTKEDERVAGGHERVGESPVREEHFGTSRSPVSFFVSEILQFENA